MATDQYLDAKGQPLPPDERQKVVDGKQLADEWLNSVIAKLESYERDPDADPDFAKLLDAYFKTTSTQDVSAVRLRYIRIRKQLTKGLTFKFDKSKTGVFGRVDRGQSDGMLLGHEFDIGLREDRAATLIHEAAHLSQGAWSWGGFRPWPWETYTRDLYSHDDPTKSVQKWTSLTSAALLSNPDVYAAFAAAVNDANYFNVWGAMPKPLRQHLGIGPGQQATASRPGNVPKRYTVRPGDNLWKIARQFYGQSSQAAVDKIYRANQKVIGPNPDLIFPGQNLQIP